jgi:hypothetical protein
MKNAEFESLGNSRRFVEAGAMKLFETGIFAYVGVRGQEP